MLLLLLLLLLLFHEAKQIPWVKQNYSRNCFSKNKITVLIKYFSDFLRKKLVNPQFSDQIHLCKVGNKTAG